MAAFSMREALGRPVVATDTAEEIGEIKSFVVDSTGRNITDVQISGRKKKAVLVAWSALEFGPDVVMASSVRSVHDVQSNRELEAAKGDIDFLGARILDTEGFEHGIVSDVEFDSSDGTIVRLHGDVSVAGTSVRSLGSYAVVVEGSQ